MIGFGAGVSTSWLVLGWQRHTLRALYTALIIVITVVRVCAVSHWVHDLLGLFYLAILDLDLNARVNVLDIEVIEVADVAGLVPSGSGWVCRPAAKGRDITHGGRLWMDWARSSGVGGGDGAKRHNTWRHGAVCDWWWWRSRWLGSGGGSYGDDIILGVPCLGVGWRSNGDLLSLVVRQRRAVSLGPVPARQWCVRLWVNVREISSVLDKRVGGNGAILQATVFPTLVWLFPGNEE